MGIIDRLGLKIRGNFCFYVIKPNTAVVVGVRHKQGKMRPIPKRIGRYTVRGIHRIFNLPQYGPTIQQLTDKQKDALRKKLEPFQHPVYGSLESLPNTVEYVGYHLDIQKDPCTIPSHIRYIDTLYVCSESLSLPNDLLYLGRIETGLGDPLRRINFYGPVSDAQPHLPLSSYLGREVENVPQIAAGAFAQCRSLNSLHLSPQLQRVGGNLFWEKRITANLPVDIDCLPRNLRHVEGDALACCRVETVHFPGDIHEEMRSQALRLRTINRLIVDDLTGLEEYTELVRSGNVPQLHPGACLYHLLRAAKNVQINVQMERIPDGMFRDCTQLSSLQFHSIPSPDQVNLGNEITSIGAEAFQNCRSIKFFFTDQLIQSIGDRAFMGCGITSFIVYGLTRTIGREAFAQCAALTRLTLLGNNTTIGEDTFAGCDKLELSPADRDRIANMPCFPSYLAIEQKRTTKVTVFLQRGDQYLRRNPVTLDAKKNAFNAYCMALQYDHHRMEIMRKIEALLLDYQVPLRIEPERLNTIRSALRYHKSDVLLAVLERTLRSLNDVCVNLCASEKISDAVLAFAINHNGEAAIILCEYFCDMLKRHAQASATARGVLCGIINSLLIFCTKPSLQSRATAVRQECVAQKQRFVVIPQEYDLDLRLDGAVERILTVQHFRRLYNRACDQAANADAALWSDIVKRLDPGQQLPKIKIQPPKEAPKPKPKPTPPSPKIIPQGIPAWTVPASIPELPDIPIPAAKPVRYIGNETEEEFERRTNELMDEIRASEEASRIAKEIEDSMYSPPGTYGGY